MKADHLPRSLRASARAALTFSLLTAFASSASAQSTPTEGAPRTEVAESGIDFCRDHWLAFAQCHDANGAGPRVELGVDLGVAAMDESGPFGFGNGIGSATTAGPAWGVRIGLEVLSWLAFEARYVGMYDSAHAASSPGGTLGFLTTGGEAVVRFTAPLPWVHPYLFGGIAYYDNALVGSSAAKAASVLLSSSQPGIPMGLGFDVPLSRHLSVGGEATYHFNLGETFASVTTNKIDGGDISTFNAVFRVRL